MLKRLLGIADNMTALDEITHGQSGEKAGCPVSG